MHTFYAKAMAVSAIPIGNYNSEVFNKIHFTNYFLFFTNTFVVIIKINIGSSNGLLPIGDSYFWNQSQHKTVVKLNGS